MPQAYFYGYGPMTETPRSLRYSYSDAGPSAKNYSVPDDTDTNNFFQPLTELTVAGKTFTWLPAIAPSLCYNPKYDFQVNWGVRCSQVRRQKIISLRFPFGKRAGKLTCPAKSCQVMRHDAGFRIVMPLAYVAFWTRDLDEKKTPGKAIHWALDKKLKEWVAPEPQTEYAGDSEIKLRVAGQAKGMHDTSEKDCLHSFFMFVMGHSAEGGLTGAEKVTTWMNRGVNGGVSGKVNGGVNEGALIAKVVEVAYRDIPTDYE